MYVVRIYRVLYIRVLAFMPPRGTRGAPRHPHLEYAFSNGFPDRRPRTCIRIFDTHLNRSRLHYTQGCIKCVLCWWVMVIHPLSHLISHPLSRLFSRLLSHPLPHLHLHIHFLLSTLLSSFVVYFFIISTY